MGLSKLISIGNKADLDETAFVEALAADPETRVIVAYLESIESGKDFVRTAAEAARTKPVVVFKSGTSSAGAKAASVAHRESPAPTLPTGPPSSGPASSGRLRRVDVRLRYGPGDAAAAEGQAGRHHHECGRPRASWPPTPSSTRGFESPRSTRAAHGRTGQVAPRCRERRQPDRRPGRRPGRSLRRGGCGCPAGRERRRDHRAAHAPGDDAKRGDGPGHFREPGNQADPGRRSWVARMCSPAAKNCSNWAFPNPSPERAVAALQSHGRVRRVEGNAAIAWWLASPSTGDAPNGCSIDASGPASSRWARRPPRTSCVPTTSTCRRGGSPPRPTTPSTWPSRSACRSP